MDTDKETVLPYSFRSNNEIIEIRSLHEIHISFEKYHFNQHHKA